MEYVISDKVIKNINGFYNNVAKKHMGTISSLYNISRRKIISQEQKSNNSPYWFIEFVEVIGLVFLFISAQLFGLRQQGLKISCH